MTIRELLSASAPCQIPDAFIDSIGEEVGAYMDVDVSDVDPAIVYRMRARLYLYLATLPNVSEGGVGISFTALEKKLFLDQARLYAKLAGDPALVPGATYGYKGQNL